MRYLLDTNTVIAWLVRADLNVSRRLQAHRRELALSAIVAHELYFGAFNSVRVEENLTVLEEIGLAVLPFDADDARAAGEIRAVLKQRGAPIDPYDVLIAGQAFARGMVMVTANVGEFGRVEGLAVEDWTQE